MPVHLAKNSPFSGRLNLGWPSSWSLWLKLWGGARVAARSVRRGCCTAGPPGRSMWVPPSWVRYVQPSRRQLRRCHRSWTRLAGREERHEAWLKRAAEPAGRPLCAARSVVSLFAAPGSSLVEAAVPSDAANPHGRCHGADLEPGPVEPPPVEQPPPRDACAPPPPAPPKSPGRRASTTTTPRGEVRGGGAAGAESSAGSASGSASKPAPTTTTPRGEVPAAAKKAESRRKRRQAKKGGGMVQAAALVGSGWIERKTGEEYTAPELRALAASGAFTVLPGGSVPSLGAVRLDADLWECVACAFPEKWTCEGRVDISADALAASPARPPAAETLREWVASRGSDALAQWCLEIGLTSLVDLAAMGDSAWLAAVAAQPPPTDVDPGFGDARARLVALMTGALP